MGRHLSWTAVAQRPLCSLPTASAEPASDGRLLEIAPKRVYPAACVAEGAVGSYPTISPLPSQQAVTAVYFLWHCPSMQPCDRTARELPGLLFCGVRTFLTPRQKRGRAAPRCTPRVRNGPIPKGDNHKRTARTGGRVIRPFSSCVLHSASAVLQRGPGRAPDRPHTRYAACHPWPARSGRSVDRA